MSVIEFLQRKTLKKEKEQTRQKTGALFCALWKASSMWSLYIYVGRDSLFVHLTFFGTGRQGGREKPQQAR